MLSGSFVTRLVLACFVVSTVSACGTIARTFGGGKNPPDEFAVVDKAPLQVPPEFTLRPPKPGEPRPQEVDPGAQTINALFPGRTTLPPPPSAGEQALLNELGTAASSPNIRSVVNDNGTLIVEKGLLLKDLLATGERQFPQDDATVERVQSTPLPPVN